MKENNKKVKLIFVPYEPSKKEINQGFENGRILLIQKGVKLIIYLTISKDIDHKDLIKDSDYKNLKKHDPINKGGCLIDFYQRKLLFVLRQKSVSFGEIQSQKINILLIQDIIKEYFLDKFNLEIIFNTKHLI